MNLTIGSWYDEPNVNFEFSHRISNYIRLIIIECIMTPLDLIDKDSDKFLHLSICTKANQDKLEVKMQRITKNTTDINCGIWLPYKSIIKSEKPIEKYIEYYIESLPLIFSKWNVTNDLIKNAGNKIKNEIIGNPHYELTDEEKDELIEEKDDLNNILNELGLD